MRAGRVVFAVALCGLSTGVLGNVYLTQDSQPVTVPEELFGGEPVKLKFNDVDDADGFAPVAELVIDATARRPSSTGLEAGTEFSVTYTLSNATFAEPVSNADLRWVDWFLNPEIDGLVRSAEYGDEIEVTRSGGGKNTNAVTFDIRLTTNITVASSTPPILALDDGDPTTPRRYVSGWTKVLAFAMPDLMVSDLLAPAPDAAPLTHGRDVTVTSTIGQTRSRGTPIVETVRDANMCGDEVLGNPAATVSCPVVEAVKVIAEISNEPGAGMISRAPADRRLKLVTRDGKPLTPHREKLATLQIQTPEDFGGARDSTGKRITGFRGDLAGNLSIEVSSPGLRDGDRIYIDADGNGAINGREAFDVTGETASDTVPLSTEAIDVWYVPNGRDPLRHGTTFTVTANTKFSDVNNRVRSAEPATATLIIQGMRGPFAKAYAIAPIGSTDVANVRVTCETAASDGCDVFLDCRDRRGANSFADAGATVGPGTTVRWDQEMIAEALGLPDGWDGRLSCDVLSSAPITVQVLTRAAGVLVNNTTISEGGT